jgi:hypothetical protein
MVKTASNDMIVPIIFSNPISIFFIKCVLIVILTQFKLTRLKFLCKIKIFGPNPSPSDMIQEKSDSDFGVKSPTVQFYAIGHNSKSNRWIELKLYQKISKVFLYIGVNL